MDAFNPIVKNMLKNHQKKSINQIKYIMENISITIIDIYLSHAWYGESGGDYDYYPKAINARTG